jgi:hypothetical protein
MAGAPPKFNPTFHIPWAFSLACDGRTEEEIADAMHVSRMTIDRWKHVWEKKEEVVRDKEGNPVLDEDGKPKKKTKMVPVLDENGEKKLSEFGQELFRGKSVADAQMEQSLFKSGTGYTIEEKEEIVEVGKDGRPKPLKIRKTTKYVQPNVMAQIYWLNNRSRNTGKWRQKQEVAVEGTIDVKAQDQKIRDALDNLTDEQLEQYEALCETMNPQT